LRMMPVSFRATAKNGLGQESFSPEGD
jgi:hypothetical protein